MWGEFPIPPAAVMLAGALILPLLPKALRSAAFLLFPLASFAIIWVMQDGARLETEFMEFTLVLCNVDQLGRVFGMIFAIIAFAGGVYAFHIKDTGSQVAALLYGGSALGVTFAGDFLTLIVYWELMAISSVYLVWARRNKEAAPAGMRYLLVHLFGGSLLLFGILMHVHETGSLAIVRLTDAGTMASWLILAGVSLNAAIPPLHAWLVDAYPRATVTGAVFLSAFTTKSAVYVLARMFPGTELLVVLGVIMALYGVVFAVLGNDIREILAYHIISQVGYMVAGVGIGTAMALNGTVAHAFSHILYKALLFMGAGVVLHTTGKSKLTELGGLAHAQPLTLLLYLIGAFSISGFPLFNGFISKSIIVSAAGEAHYDTTMLLLLLASVGTFLHTGLKIPYFTWFAEGRGITPSKPPVTMYIGMTLVAFLCVLTGVFPSLLYQHLPHAVVYEPYTLYHLTETVQILIFTFVAFWLFRRKLAGEPTITLDVDWIYRRPAGILRAIFVQGSGGLVDWMESNTQKVVNAVARHARNPAAVVDWLDRNRRARAEGDEFDPDMYRIPVGTLISIVLLGVVVLSFFGVWVLR